MQADCLPLFLSFLSLFRLASGFNIDEVVDMKYMLLILLSLLQLPVSAQDKHASGQLDIRLNKNILLPGDSLLVEIDYKDFDDQTLKPAVATLELIIENEQGQRTRLRWPVLNGKVSGAFYLPDSLPQGKYTLLAAVQQRFFEVSGKIQDAKNTRSIHAMLLAKTGNWDEQEVPVSASGTFTISNWLFEDDALMAFSATGNSKQPLNINISTQLDSSFTPLAVAGRSFYVGNPTTLVRQSLDQPVDIPATVFADGGNVLPAVMVKTVVKSPAQQFDEEHVSALFQTGNERMLSIMTDPVAQNAINLFSYLQGRVAGLQISQAAFGGGVARWRGGPVSFFLDEMRVSAQQIASLPMSDIAIVKAYPPPFIGTTGGGGAIAVYTRRGNEINYLPIGRSVFRVKGYSPTATALNMNRLNL